MVIASRACRTRPHAHPAPAVAYRRREDVTVGLFRCGTALLPLKITGATADMFPHIDETSSASNSSGGQFHPYSVRSGSRNNSSSTIICLSHLRWDFVFQRPQHLMTRAAQNHDVIFFEEPIFQPGILPRLDLSPREGGVIVAVPMLPEGLPQNMVVGQQRSMLDDLLASRAGRRLTAWFYTPMAMAFANHITADVTVYDCMDELSAFRGAPPAMLRMEQALIDQADLVFTGGRSLHDAKRHRHPHVHCFPSSIDTAHFGQSRAGLPEPEALKGLPHPRIGLFGVVDERMDLDLVAEIAARRRDWSVVIIGPVVKVDPASLPQGPNLSWLGGRGYAALPAYLANWDLGFMPFALNESTRFISPTKTPEFLAAGLPVVSTPVVDVVRDYGDAGLVEIAATAEEMVAHADALLHRPRAAWLARVDAQLSTNSWDLTWARMSGLIRQAARPMQMPQATAGGGPFVTAAAAGVANV
ncbi:MULTISPECIES: glycosyltransferase [Roseomonadaceae]|uniref:Glycosyltransferase n=1 Tax=Falsiroseomonas oleicola TaxID=2801474 RepID=A0ABS6H1H7_9PROT|nr:glycosyltransferase [Roseomonas oleicola]MBU8542508.1 glycosyltransferase [Roseomonas oleicola]